MRHTDLELIPSGRAWRLMGTLAVAILVLAGLFMAVTAAHTYDVIDQIRGLVKGQQQLSARSDCRAQYTALRSDVLEQAQSAGRQAVVDMIGALQHTGVTDAQLAADRGQLGAADARAAKLPALDAMVAHGFTWDDGMTYPPCPKVDG